MKRDKTVFYKKWWLGLCIIFVLGAGGCSKTDNTNTEILKTDNTDTEILGTDNDVSKEAAEKVNIEEVSQGNDEKNELLEFNVDWNKCTDETKQSFIGNNLYDYVKDIYIEVNEENNKITFTSELYEGATSDQALQFANDLVYKFNMCAQSQDETIENTDNYGKIYEKYSFLIGIATESQVNNSNEWYIYDSISFNKGKIKLQK